MCVTCGISFVFVRFFSNLTGCGIVDSDAQDLSACIDSVAHDPVNEVSLADNELIQLPDGVFADLTGLYYLYLDGNALTSLPSGAFSGMSLLQRLHLNDNDLSELPEGIFDGLSFLEDLDLGSNALSVLDHGVFDDLGVLQKLCVHTLFRSLTLLTEGSEDTVFSAQRLVDQATSWCSRVFRMFCVGNDLSCLNPS